MPGPAPKPDDARRRRNAPLANTTRLPAEGYNGPVPEWPYLSDEPAIWPELWRTPQAKAWSLLGWSRVVARYVSVLVMAEAVDTMTPALLGEVRQLEDRLGLTPMAMLRLRWEIAADEVAEKRESKKPDSPRKRLKVVGSDGVAGA